MKRILFLVLSITWLHAQAQQYGTGLLFDDKNYHAAPLKAELISGDYKTIPKSASLKPYCPIPGNQLKLNTSVGWATTYAAKTILEAKKRNWQDAKEIARNSFSPIFVYHLSKDTSDNNCSSPADLSTALKLLKENGAPNYMDLLQFCPSDISVATRSKATQTSKVDYVRLFDTEDNPGYKILSIKKALMEGYPVVSGMYCPPSFQLAERFWQPREQYSEDFKGQAVCVIGYDDEAFGGAFEILNSWGSSWGNDGYIWIRYRDFAEFTIYAFEVFEVPERGQEITDISGGLEFKLKDGQLMNVVPTENNGYFKMTNAYSSGTEFNIYVTNNEPAYVYVFGSDATEQIFPLFPHKPWISASLSYKSNHVVLPSEKASFKMDNTVGTDYFCFLYSMEELDFLTLRHEIEYETGQFADKVNKVLRGKLLQEQNVFWDSEGIGFTGSSKGKSVIAVIVEINHI